MSGRPLTILLTGKKKKKQPTRKRDVAVILKGSQGKPPKRVIRNKKIW